MSSLRKIGTSNLHVIWPFWYVAFNLNSVASCSGFSIITIFILVSPISFTSEALGAQACSHVLPYDIVISYLPPDFIIPKMNE